MTQPFRIFSIVEGSKLVVPVHSPDKMTIGDLIKEIQIRNIFDSVRIEALQTVKQSAFLYKGDLVSSVLKNEETIQAITKELLELQMKLVKENKVSLFPKGEPNFNSTFSYQDEKYSLLKKPLIPKFVNPLSSSFSDSGSDSTHNYPSSFKHDDHSNSEFEIDQRDYKDQDQLKKNDPKQNVLSFGKSDEILKEKEIEEITRQKEKENEYGNGKTISPLIFRTRETNEIQKQLTNQNPNQSQTKIDNNNPNQINNKVTKTKSPLIFQPIKTNEIQNELTNQNPNQSQTKIDNNSPNQSNDRTTKTKSPLIFRPIQETKNNIQEETPKQEITNEKDQKQYKNSGKQLNFISESQDNTIQFSVQNNGNNGKPQLQKNIFSQNLQFKKKEREIPIPISNQITKNEELKQEIAPRKDPKQSQIQNKIIEQNLKNNTKIVSPLIFRPKETNEIQKQLTNQNPNQSQTKIDNNNPNQINNKVTKTKSPLIFRPIKTNEIQNELTNQNQNQIKTKIDNNNNPNQINNKVTKTKSPLIFRPIQETPKQEITNEKDQKQYKNSGKQLNSISESQDNTIQFSVQNNGNNGKPQLQKNIFSQNLQFKKKENENENENTNPNLQQIPAITELKQETFGPILQKPVQSIFQKKNNLSTEYNKPQINIPSISDSNQPILITGKLNPYVASNKPNILDQNSQFNQISTTNIDSQKEMIEEIDFSDQESEDENEDDNIQNQQQQEDEEKTDSEEPPEDFLCPITQELFREPVNTPYGHTFEKEEIIQHINKKGNCPLTRKPLKVEDLVPSLLIKSFVKKWLEAHPDYLGSNSESDVSDNQETIMNNPKQIETIPLNSGMVNENNNQKKKRILVNLFPKKGKKSKQVLLIIEGRVLSFANHENNLISCDINEIEIIKKRKLKINLKISKKEQYLFQFGNKDQQTDFLEYLGNIDVQGQREHQVLSGFVLKSNGEVITTLVIELTRNKLRLTQKDTNPIITELDSIIISRDSGYSSTVSIYFVCFHQMMHIAFNSILEAKKFRNHYYLFNNILPPHKMKIFYVKTLSNNKKQNNNRGGRNVENSEEDDDDVIKIVLEDGKCTVKTHSKQKITCFASEIQHFLHQKNERLSKLKIKQHSFLLQFKDKEDRLNFVSSIKSEYFIENIKKNNQISTKIQIVTDNGVSLGEDKIVIQKNKIIVCQDGKPKISSTFDNIAIDINANNMLFVTLFIPSIWKLIKFLTPTRQTSFFFAKTSSFGKSLHHNNFCVNVKKSFLWKPKQSENVFFSLEKDRLAFLLIERKDFPKKEVLLTDIIDCHLFNNSQDIIVLSCKKKKEIHIHFSSKKHPLIFHEYFDQLKNY
ncbi:ring-type e3 ubiquitin transferase [Anaeramoeba flamelloides]|uniref:Ring-type e3 ubiquitin transferase n=1 Tax=Anaeramoeba flamelloides TaxID=1746091 RepID=A0AAV7ZPG6_9EUKA|nr:ring-type e3 ubiquitin transferase [Anaeramoeba flamelloides]